MKRIMERTRLGAALLAMALTVAATVLVVSPASASPAAAAPTARFVLTCGQLGPCLVFSRGETESMAKGEVTTAIGLVSFACALTGPFAVLCGGAAAAAGPGMLLVSKSALKQGRCAALQFYSRDLTPGGATAEPRIFPCPN